MHHPENQITLYYAPGYKGTQTLAYAKSENIPIREVNHLKTPFTGKQLLELAEKIGVPMEELVDKDNELYEEQYNGYGNFEDEDWIKIIQENPELLKTPIAVRGERAIIVSTPTDILHLHSH